jgi:hypothetical protein
MWIRRRFNITVRTSTTTAPAGSVTQIQFSLAKPRSLSAAELIVDLDPAIFGNVIAVAAFSSGGDAHGYATVEGRKVDVKCWSASGSLGQIAGKPLGRYRRIFPPCRSHVGSDRQRAR